MLFYDYCRQSYWWDTCSCCKSPEFVLNAVPSGQNSPSTLDCFREKKKGGGGGFSSPSAMVSCSGRWEDFKRLPSKKSVYPMCLPSSAEQRRKLSTRRNKVACCERKPLMGKSSRNFKKHFNGHCCGMEAANHLDYGPILFTAITRKWKELCWKWHICVSEWQWFGRICWENAEKKVSHFCIQPQEHTQANPALSPHLQSLTGVLGVSHSWGAERLVCVMTS